MSNIYELENLLNDPDYFLDEHFLSIRNKIDLRAEEKKLVMNPHAYRDIDRDRTYLFKELERFQQSCKGILEKGIFKEEIAQIKAFVEKFDKQRDDSQETLTANIQLMKNILLSFNVHFFKNDLDNSVALLGTLTRQFNGDLNRHSMKLFKPRRKYQGNMEMCNISLKYYETNNEDKITIGNFENHNVSTIAAETFVGMEGLLELTMSFNEIISIEKETFKELVNLTELSLANNALISLKAFCFHGLENLVELDLSDNKLDWTSIDENAFINLTNLTCLYLQNNNIERIESESFSGLKKLQMLYLNSNRGLTFDAHFFQGLTALRYLDLSECGIRALDSQLFRGLTELRYLGLYGNRIKSIEPQTFKDLANLEDLNLDSNRITGFEDKTLFLPLTNLVDIYLENNKFSVVERSLFEGLTKLKTVWTSASCKNEKEIPEEKVLKFRIESKVLII